MELDFGSGTKRSLECQKRKSFLHGTFKDWTKFTTQNKKIKKENQSF
jgi:hypothetical protein